MKLHQLFEETISPLKLRRDNPGGSWLKNKRNDNDAAKPNEFGSPTRLGPITGSWNKHVLLPVHLLATIKGLNGEQSRVRQHDFDGLKDIMGTTKRLPLLGSGKQYPPFIVVTQYGQPWVSEGNHRIMVAKHLGWKYMPIELRYFTGGEEEIGILSPDKVEKYNAEAERLGYNAEDFHAEGSSK